MGGWVGLREQIHPAPTFVAVMGSVSRLALVVAGLALVVAACTESSTIAEAVAADELVALSGVGDLQTRFNDDAGSPRLILLVSPT